MYGSDLPFPKEYYEGHLGRPLLVKKEFIADLRTAVENRTGYAAGKIGISQKHWMYYRILVEKETNRLKIKLFEKYLLFHGLKQAGIFPPDPQFYLAFNDFYMKAIQNIDCLGLFLYIPFELRLEKEIVSFYDLQNRLIFYKHQEPDRSSPTNEGGCYLQYFEGKRLLLICPFAEFLKQRATREIFEGVWSKTGKKWFYPKEVKAIEFPYGFAEETRQKYATAEKLYQHVIAQIEREDFDIALIAASGLAIPLATFVKARGKIGIDLGGHLQVLFGVFGKRWENREKWKRDYFNDFWVRLPEKYRPRETGVCDQGAYW